MKFMQTICFLLAVVIVMGAVLSPITTVPVYALEYESSEDLYAELEAQHVDNPAPTAYTSLFPEFRVLASILAAGGIYFTSTEHMHRAASLLYFALDSSSRDLINYYANNYAYLDGTNDRVIRVTADALAPIWNQANTR